VCTVVCRVVIHCVTKGFHRRWLVLGSQFSSGWLYVWVTVMCGLPVRWLVFVLDSDVVVVFSCLSSFCLNRCPFSLTSFFPNLTFKMKNPKTLFSFYDFKVTTNSLDLLPLTSTFRFELLSFSQ